MSLYTVALTYYIMCYIMQLGVTCAWGERERKRGEGEGERRGEEERKKRGERGGEERGRRGESGKGKKGGESPIFFYHPVYFKLL